MERVIEVENRKEKSILEMARGGFLERVDYEMAKILANIMDPNTKATGKRKLTITMELTPDDDRAMVGVSFTAKSTLVATNPVGTSLYITGDEMNGGICAVEMVPQIPGQLAFDGAEQEQPVKLKVIQTA